VAGDNAPGQVVVAGGLEQLARLGDLLADRGGEVRDIEVGAPYHSPLLTPAVEPFTADLEPVRFADAAVPVVANADAEVHVAGADWHDLLIAQLTAPVRWRETVATLAELGATEVVELGASALLAPLVQQIDPSLAARTVTVPQELG
jgi:[acyl-carrier-protein] S-malonyltransferase